MNKPTDLFVLEVVISLVSAVLITALLFEPIAEMVRGFW
jgi:hypothetical protein